jgi:hypothetical protein
MSRHPLILTLDQHGVPHRWVSWQHGVYVARDLAWDAGDTQSCANSIIAIRGKALSGRRLHPVPPLTNRELFHRDRHICAYCGEGCPAAG